MRLWVLTALLACVGGSAHAACPAPRAPANVLPLDKAKESGAALIVNASILLQTPAWSAANMRKVKASCEVGEFQAAGLTYVLVGANDKALPRIATAKQRNGPVGFVMPVPDLVTAMQGGDKTDPPPLGFLLAAWKGDTAYGWQAYDAIPSDEVLKADMSRAFSGALQPAFSLDTKTAKVTIFLPQGSR